MIETQRLLLRAWRQADRDSFWAMGQDAEVMQYLPPLTREGSDVFVDRMDALQAGHGHCFWALERKQDGAFIGFCGLLAPREPVNDIEIGWRLARAAWGQGFAREAAQASLDWAWDNLDTPVVAAITVPANTRSWGLMERLGMARVEGGDFDHPALPEGDPLRRHVLYRIARPGASAEPSAKPAAQR